ncbi:MAG: hypothetical protein M3R17_12135 [Bacteroidota bacterium]|nr:hypothetical protein [Bacteroidota bacterium]
MKTILFARTSALSAALIFLCLASCNQGSKLADNSRRAVDPVLQNDVPFRDFTVSADEGDTISLSEGTKLFIPSGIFVDADGAPVKGNVEIHYRAFYTPGEIIASGISMMYDSAGAEHIFSSAGMFEINGTQNGKPVAIAPGKAIDMDFASTRNDATYSFYKMDTASARWNYITTGQAGTNALREKLMADLASMQQSGYKPAEPKLYDPAKPVINIDVDIKDHPELAGYDGLLWQYAGSGTDPEKNKWIYETEWTSAQLTVKDSSTCMYNLNLSDATKKFSTNVYPSLKGENYQQAMAEFRQKMETFDAAETVRQEKRKNVALTTQFQRRTRIGNFGMHNWDMFASLGTPDWATAEFHFEDPEFEKQRENVAVYFIAADGRIISTYNGAAVSRLTYVKNRASSVIAILRGTNKAEIMSNIDFLSSVAPERTDHSNLKLHSTTQTVSNSKELDALIAKL